MALTDTNGKTASKPPLDGKMLRDEERVNEGFGPKMRRAARRIPFAKEAVAAYFCARDPATPLHVKAAILGALAYFIMPLDLVPDFIALLGYTDDATVFWATWKAVSGYVTEAHRSRSRTYLDGLTGKNTAKR